MNAARSSNRWDGTSASAGSSRSVRANSLDTRMKEKDTGGLEPAEPRRPSTDGDHLLPDLRLASSAVVDRICPVGRHRALVHGVPRDRGEVAPPLQPRRVLVPPGTRLDEHRGGRRGTRLDHARVGGEALARSRARVVHPHLAAAVGRDGGPRRVVTGGAHAPLAGHTEFAQRRRGIDLPPANRPTREGHHRRCPGSRWSCTAARAHRQRRTTSSGDRRCPTSC